MRSHALGICLAALAYISSGPAVAQDAVPETPPELRDFRLEEPRPAPQPQPDPPVEQTPPPEVRIVPEPTRESVTPRTRNVPPESAREVVSTTAPRLSEADADPVESPVNEQPVATSAPADPLPATVEETVAASPPVDVTASTGNRVMIFGIVGGAALLGLLAFLFWRRRRPQEAEAADEVKTHEKPASPVRAPKPELPPVAPRPLPKPPEPPIGSVSITFIPEKATISFTNLIVQGQLQIANTGKNDVKDMQLRAILLSASSGQQHVIDTFFADPAQVAPNSLGDARPGERLGLSLELSVSLNEMHAFPHGEQRLLVPIIVAALSYADEDGATKEARLACMIGREANPPQPKMGPLRLDKGPRSFAPLGQRPVYA